MSALGPGDPVLCAGSVVQGDFRAKAAAAAAGGFRGVSLFLDDYLDARAGGASDAELRGVLADHGLAVGELDTLLSWVPGAELGAGASAQGEGLFRHDEDDFYRAAQALGARSLNAVAYTDAAVPEPALAEAFAGLCERAAGHGLKVHLEFLPFTPVRDAEAALRIVETAGPNGGLLLDTWHHFRSGLPDARLAALPGERVLALQLADAPARAEADPVAETLHRRRLPGEGDVDFPAILAALRSAGAAVPIGVEVFSDELAKLPAEEAGRRAGEALRRVLAGAEA